jgi:predicted dehydrogenase
MLRAAIVGCGNIGKGHALAYAECTEIELAAVVDARHECSTDLGRTHDVPCHVSVDEVLERDDVDVIDVCVPSGLHGDVAVAAARAGKHCLCEKPLDTTPQRCDEILAAFDSSGTVLGGVYQHRFADDVRRTKAALEAGKLGRLALATCLTPWWRSQDYYDSGEWRGTWSLDGGGALMNQSIHAVDLLLWLGGPVEALAAACATRGHERIEVEDTAVAVCRFASGALGVIQGTTAAYPGSSVRHHVMGSDGTIYLVDDEIERWALRAEETADGAAPEPPRPARPKANASDPTVYNTAIFARNFDDFARAVRTGGEPTVSGREARRAVEVICAVYESARTGRWIELPFDEFRPGPLDAAPSPIT